MLKECLDILICGGPVMVPIVMISVGAWTVVFARLGSIKRESHELGQFLWRLETRLVSGGRASALELCWETSVPIASILAPLFARTSITKATRKKTVLKAIELERGRISRQLTLLPVLAGAATLLGLLGTVAGMIVSFEVVTLHGTGEPGLLAVGISQALITTEAGLVVALPLLLMHSYLSSRANRAVVNAHRKLIDISAGFAIQGGASQ